LASFGFAFTLTFARLLDRMLNLVVAVLLWPLEQLQRFASYTVTLTFNLTTVALFVTVTSVITFYVVRYHFLARYSRLPHHQATSEKAVLSSDLRPDTATQEAPERKYLPEEIFAQFLGSIKIFNYLDKTVLTEFSKRSQQRKLEPGELLWRSDERNRDLYLVMSGTMQVYLARHDFLQQQGLDGAAGDELLRDEFDGAHLLSEIQPGGTVSSLFDVLAIYADTMGALRQSRRQSVDTDLTPQSAPVGPSHASAYHDAMTASPDRGVTFEKSSTVERRHSILFARALTECTLLVIPEAAFIRVGEKFPQTAAQIAHIILTRFQRVTFLTLYKYLGTNKLLLDVIYLRLLQA
jgi:lysophospholipid hydrolase